MNVVFWVGVLAECADKPDLQDSTTSGQVVGATSNLLSPSNLKSPSNSARLDRRTEKRSLEGRLHMSLSAIRRDGRSTGRIIRSMHKDDNGYNQPFQRL
jgi:hypothetical protein